jgi:hypothetical protein
MKFSKPLISAMNTDPSIVHRLREAGYNAEEGTFGIPYQGDEQSKNLTLWDNSRFPKHFSESEIVIIDLNIIHTLPAPNGEKVLDSDGDVIRASAPYGVVDPRPFAMFRVQKILDRIFDHGGVFIVFAEPKAQITIYDSRSYRDDLNNWQFLSVLRNENFVAWADRGTQIQVTASREVLVQTLQRYFSNARFTATVNLYGHLHEQWVSLATNKFGQTVAGAFVSSNAQGGAIFVFPHMEDKAGFILEITENILPELCPQLFPFIEETKWIKQDIYQPHSVLTLREEIQQVQEQANKKVEALLAQIEVERTAQQYLTDLITQTDQSLVYAVKQTLEKLGFRDVLNYDEELEKRGVPEMREDLHIRDRSPLVLVEVKGIKGTSTEDEALQVTKYLFPRAQELERTDLRGLSIINHQRYLPPLERRPQPFSADVLTNAQHPTSGFGLLTTWNLYRFVRNFLKHDWTHDQVAGAFYRNGFIEAVPLHYKYIGTVERFIEKIGVVGILMKEGELKVGDCIAFELPIEFEEQRVTSLEFENEPVESAQADMLVGTQTTLTKDQLKVGVRVFRVEQ